MAWVFMLRRDALALRDAADLFGCVEDDSPEVIQDFFIGARNKSAVELETRMSLSAALVSFSFSPSRGRLRDAIASPCIRIKVKVREESYV